MLVVMTTVPTVEDAEKLAELIVESRLAACVQILRQVTSVYFWEGKVQKEGEHLLLIKTLQDNYDDLEKLISVNHSYDTPEIVAIRVENVYEKYSTWISSVLVVIETR